MTNPEYLIEKARKELKKWWSWSNERYFNTVDLLTKAALKLKMEKRFEESGDIFMEARAIAIKHDVDIPTHLLLEAARVYRKVNVQKAVECFTCLIASEKESGKFDLAAKYALELAEILDEDGDMTSASKYFSEAEELYLINDNTSFANKCSLKLASYDASVGKYNDAAYRYETVAKRQLNGITKHSATDNFFRSAMCSLGGKGVDYAKRKLEEFENFDPIFADSRQAHFVHDVCNAIIDADPQTISDLAREYDTVFRLDNQLTSILLAIRNSLTNVDLT
jgi:alpha-soluble NSF attachment protein